MDWRSVRAGAVCGVEGCGAGALTDTRDRRSRDAVARAHMHCKAAYNWISWIRALGIQSCARRLSRALHCHLGCRLLGSARLTIRRCTAKSIDMPSLDSVRIIIQMHMMKPNKRHADSMDTDPTTEE